MQTSPKDQLELLRKLRETLEGHMNHTETMVFIASLVDRDDGLTKVLDNIKREHALLCDIYDTVAGSKFSQEAKANQKPMDYEGLYKLIKSCVDLHVQKEKTAVRVASDLTAQLKAAYDMGAKGSGYTATTQQHKEQDPQLRERFLRNQIGSDIRTFVQKGRSIAHEDDLINVVVEAVRKQGLL